MARRHGRGRIHHWVAEARGSAKGKLVPEHGRRHGEGDEHRAELALMILGDGSELHLLVDLVLLLSVMVGHIDDLVFVELLHLMISGSICQSVFGFVFVGEANEPKIGVAGELRVERLDFLYGTRGDLAVFGEGFLELFFRDIFLQVLGEEVCVVDDVCEGIAQTLQTGLLLLGVGDVQFLVDVWQE